MKVIVSYVRGNTASSAEEKMTAGEKWCLLFLYYLFFGPKGQPHKHTVYQDH